MTTTETKLVLALTFALLATFAQGQGQECVPGNNTLGKCGCEGQLFIGPNCTEGFLCTSKVPEPGKAEGCVAKCSSTEEILVVDVPSKSWKCVNTTQTTFKCPGSFNLECETIGNFTGEGCECDAQLWMSGDCKEAFYCMSRIGGGGRSIKCEDPNQIVEVNLPQYNWTCSDNVDYCPGLGGFKVGCKEYVPPTPTDSTAGTGATESTASTDSTAGTGATDSTASTGSSAGTDATDSTAGTDATASTGETGATDSTTGTPVTETASTEDSSASRSVLSAALVSIVGLGLLL